MLGAKGVHKTLLKRGSSPSLPLGGGSKKHWLVNKLESFPPGHTMSLLATLKMYILSQILRAGCQLSILRRVQKKLLVIRHFLKSIRILKTILLRIENSIMMRLSAQSMFKRNVTSPWCFYSRMLVLSLKYTCKLIPLKNYLDKAPGQKYKRTMRRM